MQVVDAFSQIFFPLLHQPAQSIIGNLLLLVILGRWGTHGELLLLVKLSLVEELLFEEGAIVVRDVFASTQLVDGLFVGFLSFLESDHFFLHLSVVYLVLLLYLICLL